MGIFKAYDIRGIYPDEINEDLAYRIGRAFIVLTKAKTTLVGRDMRQSSPSLCESLIKGMNEQGANVVFAGMVDTPMFYFCAKDYDASLMVTASHNPGKYNGFKGCLKNVMPLTYDTGFREIERLVMENKFRPAKKIGKMSEKNFMDDFLKFSLKFAKGIKRMKVVIDAANGMGGLTFPLVFKHLDVDFECMFQEPDGRFPNHEADPLKPENMKFLQREVVKKKADIGIAPDGDADRCMFTDEKGRTIPGDIATALIAPRFLQDNPGSTILYDLRASRIVKEVVEAAGGKAIMCRVGHSFIKQAMRKENAIFAGEVSAHFYYRDNSYAESSIISSFILMRMISESGKKLSELVAPLLKYHKTEEINFNVKDKDVKMLELEKIFYDGKIIKLDGLRVDYDDWWFNVRGSNTEPLLRLNLEANTKEMMLKMKDKVSKIIQN